MIILKEKFRKNGKKFWKRYWKYAVIVLFLIASGIFRMEDVFSGEKFSIQDRRVSTDTEAASGIKGSSRIEASKDAKENRDAETVSGIKGSSRTEVSKDAKEDRDAEAASGIKGSGRTEASKSSEGSRGTEAAEEAKEGADAETSKGSEENRGIEAAENVPESTGVWVHICGKVMSPGVYCLPVGSRVFQAVEAAGGFSEDAACDYLNLAGTVSDGMQIYVPGAEEVKEGNVPLQTGGEGSETSKEDRRININTATKEELMTLKGIGESRAEDIIRFREDSGKFWKIEDIMKVPGIKEAGFRKIKDSIIV